MTGATALGLSAIRLTARYANATRGKQTQAETVSETTDTSDSEAIAISANGDYDKVELWGGSPAPYPIG